MRPSLCLALLSFAGLASSLSKVPASSIGVLGPRSNSTHGLAAIPCASPDRIYHLHIPKNAGISFGGDSLQVLSQAGLKVTSREGCYSFVEGRPDFRGVALMLREPRHHVLSQHDFCRSSFVRWYRDGVKPAGSPPLPGFAEWVRHWAGLRAAGWHGNFTPAAQLVGNSTAETTIRQVRMAAWGLPPWSEALESLDTTHWPELDGGGTIWHFVQVPFQCYSPLSLQSQRLTCRRPLEYPEHIDAELAVRNMQAAWFVGLVEAYQESICLLHAKANGTLPTFCDCTQPQLWDSFNGQHENHNAHRQSVDAYPQEVLQELDGIVAEDLVLYRAARERFVAELRQVEREHGVQVLCNASRLLG